MSPLLAVLCALSPSVEDPSLRAEYEFALSDPSRAVVEATLSLGGLSEPITLGMAEGVAYARPPAPLFVDAPSAIDGSGKVLELEQITPYTWQLDPGAATEIELRWSVPLAHRSLPEIAGRDEYEWPYVDSDHGLLAMGALALAPLTNDPVALRVELQVPDGWPVNAPWPEHADGGFEPPSLDALQSDFIVIGEWDLATQTVAGMELTMAFAPGQTELRKAAEERIAPIVAAELQLFGSTLLPKYLFVFGKPQGRGYGGSIRVTSMTLFASPDLPFDFLVSGISHLIAHEFFHTWGRARFNLPDELRWVNEGFTDYYARLIPWRIGLEDDTALQSHLRERMELFAVHQGEEAPALIESGGPAFFEGGRAYEATYTGGLTLALLTDLAIRQRGAGSLDSLMRAFHNDERWRDGTQPTLDDFVASVQEFAGAQFAARLRALVQAPGKLDLPVAFAATNTSLKETLHPMEASLQANLDTTTVRDILPTGLGALTGLKSGDRITEVNGQVVSTPEEVHRAWRAPRGGRVEVRYQRPGSDGVIHVDIEIPQVIRYELPADLARRLAD